MQLTPNQPLERVYERHTRGVALCALIAGILLVALPAPRAQAQGDDSLIVDAREAFRKKDNKRLAALRAAALNANHPLAMWVDYW